MTTAVIVPTYFSSISSPRLSFFERSLKSISNQSDTVGIVVDDGSNFPVEDFLKELGLGCLRYVRRDREESDLRTSSNAMNLGLELCIEKSGEILTQREKDDLCSVVYLHSDDILSEGSILRRLQKLTKDTPVVYTDMKISNDRRSSTSLVDARDLNAFPDFYRFPHHTLMWEINFLTELKDFCEKKYGVTGIFDSRLGAAEDRDVTLSTFYFLEVLEKRGSYDQFVSYLYHIQEDSITKNLDKKSRKKYYELLAQKHFGKNYIHGSSGLLNDLPWSLGTHLPESIKDSLRPIRDFVKKVR
jgi:glycosyltransferase involved in cell wall biosynthesis